MDLKCVLSSPTGRCYKTICTYGDWRKDFSDGRGLFWFEHPPLPLDAGNECVPQKMAKPRIDGVHLPGRHFVTRTIKAVTPKTLSLFASRFDRFGYAGEPSQIYLGTCPTSSALGFRHQFTGRQVRGTHREIEGGKTGTRQVSYPPHNVVQKGSSHIRSVKKFFLFAKSCCEVMFARLAR